MNRLVLIGNGFDLAHGMKTSYADFIHWYKAHRVEMLGQEHSNVSKDHLCTIELKEHHALSIYISNLLWAKQNWSHEDCFEYIVQNTHEFKYDPSRLLKRILNSIETKGWADIENDYYILLKEYAFPKEAIPSEEKEKKIRALNRQLEKLQDQLIQYLKEVNEQKTNIIDDIKEAIYAPFKENDIAIAEKKHLQEHVNHWGNPSYDIVLKDIINLYALDADEYLSELNAWRNKINHAVCSPYISSCPKAFLLPNNIMFLNFNYTNIVDQYIKTPDSLVNNHIHGEIAHPESIIFGYGDELDVRYTELQELGNNDCLKNIKSIRYLEAQNYRNLLSFIESEPFQVLIMGHSCGNSDRTLLNTIFEHKNCVSIKPYYYITDKEKGTNNYRELAQNISRNFTNMKLMRDRVVNKTQCEPLLKE